MAFVGDIPPAAVIIDPSAASFKIERCETAVFRAKETVAMVNADNSVLEGIRNVSKLLTRRKIRIHEKTVR